MGDHPTACAQNGIHWKDHKFMYLQTGVATVGCAALVPMSQTVRILLYMCIKVKHAEGQRK